MLILDASRRQHAVPPLARWCLSAGIAATLSCRPECAELARPHENTILLSVDSVSGLPTVPLPLRARIGDSEIMDGVEHEHAQVGQMQAALRAWVRRLASVRTRSLQDMSSSVFLARLYAAAFSPLVVGSELEPDGFAGSVALASLNGGALTQIVVCALDQARSDIKVPNAPTAPLLEDEIAKRISLALTAEDTSAQTLRAEIAVVPVRLRL